MPKNRKNNTKVFYALSIAFQLGFIISVPIIAFIIVGIFADRFFQSQPALLLLGLLLGIIVTIYEVYHLLMPLVKEEKHD